MKIPFTITKEIKSNSSIERKHFTIHPEYDTEIHINFDYKNGLAKYRLKFPNEMKPIEFNFFIFKFPQEQDIE
jgi:hypothetical protein